MSGKVYIYNYKQAYYYMSKGVMPLDKPEVHFRTGKIFFVFDWHEAREVYDEWCRNHQE